MSQPSKEEKERMEFSFGAICFTAFIAAAFSICSKIYEAWVAGVIG